MKDLYKAKDEIRTFLDGSDGWRFVSAETGELLCPPQAFALELAYQKLILRIRHKNRTFCGKILDYRIDPGEALYLKLGRSNRRDVTRLVIARPSAKSSALELKARRKAFRKILQSEIRRHMAVIHQIKNHSHHAQLFARFSAESKGRRVAIIGAGSEENPSEVGRIVSAGLVWQAQLEARGHVPAELYVFVPTESADTAARKAAWVDKRAARISVIETSVDPSGALRFRAVKSEELTERADHYAWPARGLYKTSPLLMRVINLAPTLIRRHPSYKGFDSLRILGLEFGRVYGHRRDAVRFGVGEEKRILNEETWPDLKSLVVEMVDKRRHNSPDKNHPFYRLQEERWLESLILDDVRKLSIDFDERFVYPQVPVYLGAERGMADVLTVTSQGRLVVIEVKVSEDMDLPLQGLDYWSAVHWHNQRGDFQKRGYFQGINVSKQYPLLYLVAPLFRFHKTFETVVRSLRREVEVTKVGINLNWKRELKVLRSSCRFV
jgi:hypothetical protein